MRSEEAVDVFSGFTSSDSEDSNESEAEPLKIPAGTVDQHRAAKRNTKAPNSVRAAATSETFIGNKAKTTDNHSASVTSALVSAVDDSSIKRERSACPSPLLQLTEHHTSLKKVVVALEAEQVPSSGTNANHLIPTLARHRSYKYQGLVLFNTFIQWSGNETGKISSHAATPSIELAYLPVRITALSRS